MNFNAPIFDYKAISPEAATEIRSRLRAQLRNFEDVRLSAALMAAIEARIIATLAEAKREGLIVATIV